MRRRRRAPTPRSLPHRQLRNVATTAETPDESADLVRAGDAASSDGVKMYSAWLANLTPEQKDAIKQHHSRWSKAAKAADAQGAPGS